MTQLPRPQAVIDEQKQTLRTLLDAELFLIQLVERLSRDFIHIDAHTARRWAPWMSSLQQDPAFQLLKPALNSPEAWPQIWTRARTLGFSPATEHHNWIFFTRFFERAHEARRFDLARDAFSEALTSLLALAETDFLPLRLSEARQTIPESLHPQILATLFDPPLELLAHFGRDALNFAHWDKAPSNRQLSYLFELLNHADQLLAAPPGSEPGNEPPLKSNANALQTGLHQGLAALRESLSFEIAAELQRRLESTDLLEATGSDILSLLDGSLRRYDAIHRPLDLARALLRTGLAIIWDLREINREEELAIFSSLLDRLTPLATDLEKALQSQSATPTILAGLEGTLADLFVFQGEDALQLDHRESWFRRALKTCPGHRNASRLLSYLLIEKVNRELLKLSAIPSVTTRVAPLKEPVQKILRRARKQLDEAADVFPSNDLLDRYREDLAREEDRFRSAPTPTEEPDNESR